MVKSKKTAKAPTRKAKKKNSPSKGQNTTAAPNDLFPKIQAIIAKQLKKKPAEVQLGSNLQTDLSADSLDAMEIIFQLEETFKLQVAEEAAAKMVTVRDIVAYVARHA